MAVSLSQTFDLALVKKIMSDKDIWDRASDEVNINYYQPSADDIWLLVLSDLDIVGIIGIHGTSSCCVDFHPYLKKKHRPKCRIMIFELYNWFIDNIPINYVKMNTTIPTCFMSAINTAHNTGLTHEGTCRKSYIRNGELYDRYFLGITRDEMVTICHKQSQQ